MCTPGELPAGTIVSVTLFEGAHTAAEAAMPSTARLASVQQCDALQVRCSQRTCTCYIAHRLLLIHADA